MKFLGFEITRSKQQQPQATADKSLMPINSYGSPMTYWQPQSAFLTAMGANSNALQLGIDPRMKLITYQTMVAALPVVSRQLGFHVSTMGTPRIASDDEAFQDEANAMLEAMQWRGQLDFEGNRENGLGNLIKCMAFNTMTLGQSFYTLLDSQGMPAITSRQKVDAVQFHDSERFIYAATMPDVYRLEYQAKGQIEQDKKLGEKWAFHTVRLGSDARYPWGKPTLADAEHIAMRCAVILESQLMTYRRAAASPTMTIFSIEPVQANEAAADNIQIIEKNAREWDAKSQLLVQSYRDMLRDSYKSGTGGEAITSVIGKLNMETKSAADGLTIMPSYNSDIKLELAQLVIAMHGSPDLFGLGSGDGMNSNRSQILMAAMEEYGINLRKAMQVHADRIFQTTATRLSKRLPKYTWEWDGISLSDLKAKADAELVIAQTENTWVTAMMAMLTAGEIAMAKKFADEKGLDWAELASGAGVGGEML